MDATGWSAGRGWWSLSETRAAARDSLFRALRTHLHVRLAQRRPGLAGCPPHSLTYSGSTSTVTGTVYPAARASTIKVLLSEPMRSARRGDHA